MSVSEKYIVKDTPGYNSWPMIRNIDSRLICAYSKGKAHDISEACRGVYASYSDDNGESWSRETQICNSDTFGEVTIGKGVDHNGSALFWVRCCKAGSWPMELHHELYRTADGMNFEKISSPVLDPVPMQITDIFHIPEKNEMMALWFSGNYRDNSNSWGTLVSTDNGISWQQHTIEDSLPKDQWPTEQSAVYLGGGRILAIARTEISGPGRTQFQLESSDFGRTWNKCFTNIDDIRQSTPALLLTPDGRVCNYYCQRGSGLLKRRTVSVEDIWGKPASWPDPEVIGSTSIRDYHAGNVNAAAAGGKHFISCYSGNEKNTAVLVFRTELPEK